MLLRPIVFLLLICSSLLPAVAQVRQRKQKTITTENMPKYDRRKFHFGINLSIVTTGLAIRPIPDLRVLLPDTVYAINNSWQPGFSMGIETNMRLGELWDLRFTPSLSLSSRSISFDRPNNDKDNFEIESTLTEFPIYIKFKSVRLTNWRMYLIGGAKYQFDLSSKIGADDGGEYPIKMNRHDILAEMGTGMDFYLPYFKFSIQFKAFWGFMDMKYKEDNLYNNAIESMYNRGFFISFLFE